MFNQELQEVELDIETAKRQIELGDTLERLQKNEDWKTIIEDLYLDKEPARLVLFKASPIVKQQPMMHKDICEQIDAIGVFFHFLLTIRQQAESARNKLQQNIETRQEILDEQLETIGAVQ